MEPLSKIVVMAMNEITCGTFKILPKLAATGLTARFPVRLVTTIQHTIQIRNARLCQVPV